MKLIIIVSKCKSLNSIQIGKYIKSFYSSIFNFETISNINDNNSKKNNYIEFNKIKLVLISNYGNKKYIGLTGIEFYNIRDELVRIETATTIGALPKDLHTIYEDENEERIFENVFNNFNNTNDKENMWVTQLKNSDPKTFIEIFFENNLKTL